MVIYCIKNEIFFAITESKQAGLKVVHSEVLFVKQGLDYIGLESLSVLKEYLPRVVSFDLVERSVINDDSDVRPAVQSVFTVQEVFVAVFQSSENGKTRIFFIFLQYQSSVNVVDFYNSFDFTCLIKVICTRVVT